VIINQTYISHSDIHGYGVFVTEDIKTGDIIIQHPCVPIQSRRPIPPEIATHMFGTSAGIAAVFGNASYINSSKTPNVRHELDFKSNVITVTAIQDIAENEEITLNYM
jgi:SET domain-containing protein